MPGLWRRRRGPTLDDLVARAAARPEPVDREGIAAAISDYLAAFDAPAAVRDALEVLRAPGTVAVVTGQQPVLLGGPAYVLYKALTAIRVARELSARGVPAVAIFWNASEDHDIAEANVVALPGADGWRRHALDDLPALTRRPLSDVPLGATNSAQINAWSAAAGWSDVAPLASPSDTLASWQTAAMLRALGEYGLLVVEPHLLRPFAGELFGRLLDEFDDLSRDLDTAIAGLADVAPEAREHRLTTNAPLFAMVDGERQRISRETDNFSDVAARARANPLQFSTTALSRPLMQNLVLPTVAYVCGPAELTYNALLDPWHARLGIQPAALIRRASMTVANATTSAGDVVAAITARATAREAIVTLQQADETMLRDLHAALRTLEDDAPAAAAAVAQSLDRLDHAARRRAARAQQARLQSPLAQLRDLSPAVRAAARRVEPVPHKLQERVIPWLHLLATHGRAIIDVLLDDGVEPLPDHHLVVSVRQ